MKLIKKILLYIDSIRRMPIKQNYFLFKEKLYNKLTTIKVSSLDEIADKRNCADLKNNLSANIHMMNLRDEILIWDAGVNDSGFKNNYFKRLAKVLDNYFIENDLIMVATAWKEKEHDIEVLYNFQRMHGFPEYINEKNISFNKITILLLAWIDNFPPERNVAWTGFNCAVRLINWVKIFSKFSDNEIQNLDEKIIISILQQTEFIEKNIEHHIPGNHVIFQFFAVWLVGYLFGIPDYKKYGYQFENEFNNEYLEDGLHFELSTHYHIQVLLLGIYYSLINQKNTNNQFFLKLNKAIDVADAFTFSDSYIPLIGDNCYNFFHFNIAQDLANLNELKKYLDGYKGKDSNVFQFDDQYLIAKNQNSKLIFDVGDLGMKYNPGHGHSDLLSFNYTFGGKPIFIDPGTKRYSNDKDSLKFKKSNSHNTIFIEGSDHAVLWGFFRWAYLPRSPKYSVKSDGKFVNLIAEFQNNFNNKIIRHKRNILFFDTGFKIIDEFSAKNEVLTNVLILHDSVKPELYNDDLILKNEKNEFSLSIKSESKFDLEIIPQSIFPAYDYEVKSKKIVMKFQCADKIKSEMIFNLIS